MSLPILELVTHTQRVKRLYKSVLRNLESWYDRREVYRYYAVLMRQRFDSYRHIHDSRIATEILKNGEEELFQKTHWHRRRFPTSHGGTAFEREVIPPDWVLDQWHPLEKAQYPEYFERREQRKMEYVRYWKELYGNK